jgi:hypothetical protein
MRSAGRIAVALLLLPWTTTAAQTSSAVRLEIFPPSASVPSEPAAFASTNVLRDAKIRELMRHGFPAQIDYRVELWRKAGLFDDIVGTDHWSVRVGYDAATQFYRISRRHGSTIEEFGRFASLDDVEAALSRAYMIRLRPRRGGRYYYTFQVDIQTLSISDLDELNRWLKGDLQPAVRGQRNAATAVQRGLGTLLSRVLGGEKRHYEERSRVFAG